MICNPGSSFFLTRPCHLILNALATSCVSEDVKTPLIKTIKRFSIIQVLTADG